MSDSAWEKPPKVTTLTTVELYLLDKACGPILDAFGGHNPPYLVGSAATGAPYRDVDVRLMLEDAEFAATCPTRERWNLLCLAISVYLSERTGLKVDFQIQRATVANERYGDKPRNPLGDFHEFAGGGDGVDWIGMAART